VSALKSLWRYNFTPDVGLIARFTSLPLVCHAGRSGLLHVHLRRKARIGTMRKAKGKARNWAAGYFNECNERLRIPGPPATCSGRNA